MSLSDSVRQQVRARAKHYCEYCLSHQDYIMGHLQIDHIQPSAKGGNDSIIDLLPRLENGGFWNQAATAGTARLTSPNPMAEAPAILIFIAAFSSRSFSAEQAGHRQWRVSKSRCAKT
jgi:hypothetical protein